MTIKVTYNVTDIYVSESVSATYINVSYEAPSGGGGAVWGDIIGTLSDQADLQAALDAKVPYSGATANVDLGEYELKAGQIEFDQTPTGTAGVAVTRWNDSTGTIETTLKGGSVVLEHGRDMFERVVNKTGIQLTKAAYQAVRVSNAQGQRLAVQLAQANNDNNSADTIGLVVETIDNNQEGYIYTVGEIDGVNTTGTLQGETWVDGDVLYLSPTTAGRITNIKPVAPQHLVIIGYVVYAHQNNGKIYVKVMNGWELGELHDVDTTGAVAGNVLKYNGTIWTPSGDVGITSLNGLTATTQTFSLDTRGNDVAIVSSGSNHEFIFPSASATRRGVLTSADWSLFFNKIGGSGTIGTMPIFTGTGAIGNSIVNITNGLVNIDGVGNLSDYALQIGTGRTNNGFAYIDLVGDATYSDYGFRLMRNNTGANATSVLEHRGTGDFIFKTVDNANLYLQTGSTNRVFVEANSGALNVANTSAVFLANTGEQLIVNGSAKFASSVTANSLVKSGGTSSQYLMADGSTSTLTNPVTGTGVSGQVSYWSGTNTQTGSNNLFWDNTNIRLGIGTNTPSKTFDVNGEALIRDTLNVTTGITKGINFASTRLSEPTNSSTFTQILIQPSLGNKASVFQIAPSGTSTATAIEVYSNSGLTATDRFVFKNTTGLLQIGADGASLPLSFISNNVNQFYMFGNGNIRLQAGGTFTDSGQRLQVTGDTLLKGSGNTSATTALTVQNSDGTNILTARNDGRVVISSTTTHQLEVAYPSGGRLLISAQSTANSFTLLDSQGFGFTHNTNYTGINARQTNINLWTQAADTTTLGLGGQDTNPTTARTRTFIQPVTSATTAFAPTSGTAIDYLFRTTGNANFVPTSGTATYTQVQFSPTINQTGGANGITRGLYVNPTLTSAADWRSIEWSNNTGWGLYGAGSAPSYFGGSVAIGGTTNITSRNLNILKNITGNATSYAVIQEGVVQSDVTGTATGYFNAITTQNATFTLLRYVHFDAQQGTIGASSTVTNQFGFRAASSLTAATNNYGFYGDIAAATGRWNLYMNGTAANYLNGSLFVGSTTPLGTEKFGVYGTNAGGAVLIRIYNTGTTTGTFASLNLSTQTGSGGTVASSQIASLATDAVGNNAITFSNSTAGTFSEKMRIHPSGNLGINTGATDSGERLQVTGTMKVTGASTFGGNMTLSLNQNANTSFSVSNTTSGTSSMATINLISNGGTQAVIGKYSSTTTPYKTILSNDFSIYNNPSFGDISILNDNTSGSIKFAAGGSSTAQWTIGSNGDLTAADGENIIVGSTNGTKLGTATSQKIGFWNATPIVQPTTAVAEATFVENSGGTAVNVDSTFDGYTMQQVVKALRNAGLLA